MYVKRNSERHGTGVFAVETIPAGTPLFEMRCEPLLSAEDITPDMRVMQIDDELYSGESGGDEDYLNHSCEPNLGFVDGSSMLASLRDIRPGEELVWNYSTSENEAGWEIPCMCGTLSCRGVIKSFCDLPPAEQNRLLPTTLSYLRRYFFSRAASS